VLIYGKMNVLCKVDNIVNEFNLILLVLFVVYCRFITISALAENSYLWLSLHISCKIDFRFARTL